MPPESPPPKNLFTEPLSQVLDIVMNHFGHHNYIITLTIFDPNRTEGSCLAVLPSDPGLALRATLEHQKSTTRSLLQYASHLCKPNMGESLLLKYTVEGLAPPDPSLVESATIHTARRGDDGTLSSTSPPTDLTQPNP